LILLYENLIVYYIVSFLWYYIDNSNRKKTVNFRFRIEESFKYPGERLYILPEGDTDFEIEANLWAMYGYTIELNTNKEIKRFLYNGEEIPMRNFFSLERPYAYIVLKGDFVFSGHELLSFPDNRKKIQLLPEAQDEILQVFKEVYIDGTSSEPTSVKSKIVEEPKASEKSTAAIEHARAVESLVQNVATEDKKKRFGFW
jgi:hypothetical protein